MEGFKTVPTTPNTAHHNSSHMYYHSAFFLRGGEAEETSRISSGRFGGMGELDQFPSVFHHNDAVDLTRLSSVFGPLNQNLLVASSTAPPITVNTGSSAAVAPPSAAPSAAMVVGVEDWRGPALGNTTHQTDTSADVDTDDRNQCGGRVQRGATVLKPTRQSKRKSEHRNVTYQRLAQNREAARKSRLRKKEYVQQLESSRFKLTQLEQELENARQQDVVVATAFSVDQGHANGGTLAFDLHYGRWLDEHQRVINELRSAISTHLPDEDLRVLVDAVMLHYSEFFKLKGMGSKSDIFHMLSGMWITPAERFFMWLGGFRSSELLKILVSYLEPLMDQQLMGFCNLQQSCQQAEDALSQGMEALQQSLVETLSSTCIGTEGSGNMADYMDRMARAMTKLATLQNFVHQADLLRQQTLQQLHRILTPRQAARVLLVIHDYTSRLRALSSLWLARPRTDI